MSTEITTNSKEKIIHLLEEIVNSGERYMIFTKKLENGQYWIEAVEQEEEPEIISISS